MDISSESVRKRLLSKTEVAKFLGYTVRTVDRLIASQRIPFVRIPTAMGNGTKIKFDIMELDKWIVAHSHDTTEPEGTPEVKLPITPEPPPVPQPSPRVPRPPPEINLREVALKLLARD